MLSSNDLRGFASSKNMLLWSEIAKAIINRSEFYVSRTKLTKLWSNLLALRCAACFVSGQEEVHSTAL